MIAKMREFPMEIRILEAIVRRFPPLNPRKSEFENKLARKRAGFKGEKELDYHISRIDHSNFTILHDLRIPHNDTHFQIDNLLISPSFILVIDSKNHAGTLEFYHEFNQLIQSLNGLEKVYLDPILQTKIQASQIKSFLLNHQISPPPIEFLVAISNSQAIIKNPSQDKEVSHRVFKTAAVSFKIKPFEDKYRRELLSKNEIKKVVKLLLKKHVPFIPDIEALNLPLDQMRRGVQCPECDSFGMDRLHGSWVCNQCGRLSKDAHVGALHDFFMIYGPIITSRQFCDFLGIGSIHLAKRLLSTLDLVGTGTKKGRAYTPTENFYKSLYR